MRLNILRGSILCKQMCKLSSSINPCNTRLFEFISLDLLIKAIMSRLEMKGRRKVLQSHQEHSGIGKWLQSTERTGRPNQRKGGGRITCFTL